MGRIGRGTEMRAATNQYELLAGQAGLRPKRGVENFGMDGVCGQEEEGAIKFLQPVLAC